jgi:hypothetical protein
MLRRFVGFVIRLAVMTALFYRFVYKPWRARWQATPDEAARALAGDGLVPDAQFRQTMALTIAAPPSAVWPWLLQMGFGRAGWYSYDAIDMLGHSARAIQPELQDLRAGQLVPLAPNLDFRVDVLEPEHALVLYGDSQLAGRAKPTQAVPGEKHEESSGLKMVGLLADANMSAFAVSWAFVLEPTEDGQTRLLERFRTTTTPGPAAAVVTPLIDVGHFLMTRKHMLGIKERAESKLGLTGTSTPQPAPSVEPAPAVPVG